MEQADNAKNAEVFRAFADENRLNIIDMLSGNEQNATVLLDSMNISQSTLSHHMKILCESGVVESRRDGKWTYYSLSEEGLNTAVRYLDSIKSGKTTEKPKGDHADSAEAIAPIGTHSDGADRHSKPKAVKTDPPAKKKRSGSDDMSWLF